MSITITPANNITITLGAQGPAGQDGEDGNITSATATDIDGILKGDGATISAAVAGVDYLESASIPDELTDLDTTVTGAQLNSLKTKVDGIESSATADQTGAEIKALYEAESDTNAFTDSDHSKLDGIEAGADVTNTANVTAAGALMDSEVTNLAEVKAFDPTDYATAAQGATADTAIQPADISGLTGGTTGQIATKASGDDYDLTWADDLTVPGLLTADHIHGNIAGTLYIHVKNTSGGTLAKGTPVYVTGHVGSSDRVEVAAADQSDPAKMPAIALLAEELPDNGEGDGVIVGEIRTFDTVTPGYALNDELFVGTAALTDTKPTTGVVQPVATVARLQSSTGVLVINCQGQRSPDENFATAAQGALADTALQAANNLSDLDSAATARSNLGAEQAGTATRKAIAMAIVFS